MKVLKLEIYSKRAAVKHRKKQLKVNKLLNHTQIKI